MTDGARPVETRRLQSGKLRLFEVLELSGHDPVGRAVSIFLAALIAVNVLFTILETVPEVAQEYGTLLYGFELASVAIFLVEYLLRLWSSTADPRYEGRFRGRLRYASTPLAIVDLLAIAPALLPFLGVDLRMLRVLRLLRVLKLGRHSEGLRILQTVVTSRRRELGVSLLLLVVLLVMASSVMYYAEHEAQPHKFGSIPQSMWWGIVSLTTVGYGDAYPITAVGKLVAGITVVIGVAVVAIPAAVFASGFIDELQKRTAAAKEKPCPHCGKDVHAPVKAEEPPTIKR